MIRWINARLGTGGHDSLGEGDWVVIDVRHLLDKGGNPPGPVRAAVEEGARAYRAGRRVVVACDFGISRSNAIAAGVLSLGEDIPFDGAVAQVLAATGEAEVKLDMIQTVRRALDLSSGLRDRRTVLVTGGHGFLGRQLIPRLEPGFKVVAPTRRALDLDQGAVPLADLCAREGVGQIVHLAYPRVYTNASAAGASLTMLRTVIDVCRLLKIRLVFVSSWVLYSGYQAEELAVDEATPMRPKGVYAEGKYLEETLLELYAQRGDIERSICRFTPVYGPGGLAPRLISKFHKAALAGETITTHRYRNGRPALDLLHVSDAASALTAVVAHETPDAFHFGGGVLNTTQQLARLIGGIAGRPAQLDEIVMDEDIGNIVFPAEKARALLGWAPRTTVEQGLASLLAAD